MEFDLNKRATDERLEEFADKIKELSEQIGFKVSARGWCYQLETERVINKDEFDKVESWINKCRKKGILPIDFTAEEEGRKFSCVDIPHEDSPVQEMKSWIEASMNSHVYYNPNWWDGETYYIQMLVEKVDLKTLFMPICKKYHIPIATSKGWSSMLQRAEYARRFKEAEDKGLKCVLLYCGDHDPDMSYVQEYISTYGVRKCEANAIIPMPDIAMDFVEEAITAFLGDGALGRFAKKREDVVKELSEFKEKTGLQEALQNALDLIDEEDN